VKVRVLTDAGVQQFVQVATGYDASTGSAAFERLEVRKPNGDVARPSADATKDVALQIFPGVVTDMHQPVDLRVSRTPSERH
jgi:hypothetical protein